MLRRITASTPRPAYSQDELERTEEPTGTPNTLPAMERHGIEALEKIARLGINLEIATRKSLQDGEFSGSDLVHYGSVLLSLPSTWAALREVPKEARNLSRAEIEELVNGIEGHASAATVQIIEGLLLAGDGALDAAGLNIPNE